MIPARQQLPGDDKCCAQVGYVIRFVRVEFHRSSRKHWVDTDDVLHAVANALVVADMGDDESPLRILVLGPDRSGNMLEVIVLHFDDTRDGDPRDADANPLPRVAPRPPETRP